MKQSNTYSNVSIEFLSSQSLFCLDNVITLYILKKFEIYKDQQKNLIIYSGEFPKFENL